jgi:uncharacterized membrane protein
MGKGRLEAFTDGVIAIIITIMVAGAQGASRRRLQRAPRERPGFLA